MSIPLPLKFRRKSDHSDLEDAPYNIPVSRSPSFSSSSHACSSSPPMTPYSQHNSYNYHIKSSPRLGSSFDLGPDDADHGLFLSKWRRSHSRNIDPKTTAKPQFSLPSFRSAFASDDDPLRPDYYHSELDTGYERSIDDGSVFFSDSDDEDDGHAPQDAEEGYSFENVDARAVYFEESSERGRWKSDPMPPRYQFRSLRKSAPTTSPSPLSAPSQPPRLISEPAPSKTDPDSYESQHHSRAASVVSSSSMLESDPLQSLPSLSSDNTSNEDINDHHHARSLSPLPSSSPPISPLSVTLPLSPMLLPIFESSTTTISSPIVSSELETDHAPPQSSPLSIALSSPLPYERSSPLSFGPSPSSLHIVANDDCDEFDIDLSNNDEVLATAEVENHASSLDVAVESGSDTLAQMHQTLTATTPTSTGGDTHIPETDQPINSPHPDQPDLASTLNLTSIVPQSSDSSVALSPIFADIQNKGELTPPTTSLTTKSSVVFVPAEPSGEPSLKGREENGAVDMEVVDAEAQGSVERVDIEKAATREVMDAMNLWERGQRASEMAGKEKEKERRKRPSDIGEGPVKKRKRVSSSEEEARKSRITKGKGKAVVFESKTTSAESLVEEKPKRKRKVDPESDQSKSAHADGAFPPKAKKPRQEGENAKSKAKGHSRPKCSSDSTTTASTSTAASVPSSSSSSGADPGLDSEICGLLIESMASSRASSLATSSLYKSVMQNHPRLKAQKSEKEWTAVFERVLRAGERKGTGVFGKVESNGQEEPDHPLEAQWFYVPERDEDQERAMLIRSMMPRPAKRSETKKYKQYYYRPLDKISRWDPEDEI